MARSHKSIIEGIEQRGEPVPGGYSYNPRRDPKLEKLDSPVATGQRNEDSEETDEEASDELAGSSE